MPRFIVDCDSCGAPVSAGYPDSKCICADCVREMIEPPTLAIKKETGFPKGWRFMKEFVHTNGKVYHKGIEQPSLFGTLKPTEIIVKQKISKHDKQQKRDKALAEIVSLKKQLKKETRKTYIKKIESRLNKLQKEI